MSCKCGNPVQTTLKYQFKSPTGYKCSTEVESCENCGPQALREAAETFEFWSQAMEKASPEVKRYLKPTLETPPDWSPTEEEWEKWRSVIFSEERYQWIRDNHTPGGNENFHWLLQIWGDRSPEPEESRDTHTEHCCLVHGCKYRDPRCPVVSGEKVQSYTCESCSEDLRDQSEFNVRKKELQSALLRGK